MTCPFVNYIDLTFTLVGNYYGIIKNSKCFMLIIIY